MSTESERMEKDIPGSGNEKWAGVTILTSENLVFEVKNIKIDEERHHIMIKGSIQQEENMIISVYTPKPWSLAK